MNGNTDLYFVESSEAAQHDSALQDWAQEGDIIDLSDQSTPFVFDQSAGVCA